MKDTMEIVNRLAEFREKRGFSAAVLAKNIGVSRQTIYAMEAGDYVPNTAVALKLARALEATVEEIFRLPEAGSLPTQQAALMPDAGSSAPGTRIQLCRVDEKLIASAPPPVEWHFSPSDGSVVSYTPNNKVKLQVLFHAEHEYRHRISIAGCDPAVSVLARHVQLAGIELILSQRNSSQSLSLLHGSYIHIAGSHLRDESTGESNLPTVKKSFPRNSVAVVSFAEWQQGFLTQRNNPKSIKNAGYLSKKGILIVNREHGSGSRVLLDAELKRAGISGTQVQGYDRLVDGHLTAAWHVRAGLADCCVATEAAARAFDLDFIPLTTERYDLVIRRRHLDLPGIQILLDTLNRSSFRRELEGLGGYDTRTTGSKLM